MLLLRARSCFSQQAWNRDDDEIVCFARGVAALVTALCAAAARARRSFSDRVSPQFDARSSGIHALTAFRMAITDVHRRMGPEQPRSLLHELNPY
mmetsp:Transcript_1600/g.3331  ORF Transcript_1600/g.3331 Transcript_1600/m.3331 type:complete len:95 (+) Transcript_1600:1872-2156(+)|eukprot:6192479-Pleurochrysis_carterae.AAC.4